MTPRELLAEAAEWRLFGLLFEYPTAQWRVGLETLLPDLPRPELRAMAEAALRHHSEGLHTALFGPAGSVPVREVAHQGGVQFGYLMAELAAYYDAFAYAPRIEEAADHLAVELGFVAYLKMKQAIALLEGDSEHASRADEAAASFLADHIATQAGAVLVRLENFAPEYLVQCGRLVLKYAGPSRASGFPLGSAMPDDDQPMSCEPGKPITELIQLHP